ncbi:MAG TPA: hypothetical protein VNK06_08595 [Thermodesulfobacteriota bacterium]|nr:hypothetical protein [Thermodesulfobacteriota bacterium]
MPKSVTALKDILAREEKLLAKLRDTVKLLAHKESKAVLNALVRAKKESIGAYKSIIKNSQKCPAVSSATKKAAKKPAKKASKARR